MEVRFHEALIIEKGLEDRIDIVPAQTRLTDGPYHSVNPSGRVPYLVRDDGVGMEESTVICGYLDHLDGRPQFDLPAGDLEWEARRLGALASSLLDGLSVWGREIARPENEQSRTIIRHEIDRANRMADLWEEEIEHPLMCGGLNLVQITPPVPSGWKCATPNFTGDLCTRNCAPGSTASPPGGPSPRKRRPIECGLAQRIGIPALGTVRKRLSTR